MEHNLKRVRFVTGNFHSLQGFRAFPVAGWLIGTALLHLIHPAILFSRFAFVGISLAMIMVYLLIGRYYQATFGIVIPRTAKHQAFVAYTAMFTFMGAGIALDTFVHPPIYGESIAIMVSLLGYWWQHRLYRWHYAIAGLLLGIAGFLPLALPWANANPQQSAFGALFTLGFGVVWLLVGSIDHALLRYVFTYPREVGHAHV